MVGRGEVAGVRRVPSGYLYTREDLPRQEGFVAPKSPARMIRTDAAGWVPGSVPAPHHDGPVRREVGRGVLVLTPEGLYEWMESA